MNRTQRNDRSGKLSNVRKDNRGGLRVPATPTRTGVFVYRNADGSERRELRHPLEVFKQDSMESLAGVPLTVGHPPHAVTAATWKSDAVGHANENPRQDGKFVANELFVTDAATVKEVEAGNLLELSCGYECDLDMSPGVWEGERYDAIQRNISYNHIALLPAGCARGGPEVKMHLDEGEALEGAPVQHEDNVSLMELEELKKKLAVLEARADALEAENKTLRARADAAEAASTPEKLDARVAAAVKLREDARKVLGNELPATDKDILVAVITKRDPAFKADGKDLVYLQARFDAELCAAGREGLAAVQSATKTDAASTKSDAVEAARQEMLKRNADRFAKGV